MSKDYGGVTRVKVKEGVDMAKTVSRLIGLLGDMIDPLEQEILSGGMSSDDYKHATGRAMAYREARECIREAFLQGVEDED